MEFEDVLEKTGGFGKFQKKLAVLFLIPINFFLPWFWMNKIFMLSVPQHWCNVPELSLSNLSIAEQRHLISPPSDPSCSMFNVSYARMVKEGRFVVPNDTEIIPCRAGWQYDTENYDETAASKWDMVCDNNYFPSLIFTLSSAGHFVAASLYGYLSDKFGRKVVYLSLAGLIVITEVASGLSNDLAVFIALRVLNGTVMPTLFSLPVILVSELVPPNVRADINGLVNTSWTLGMCLLPLVAYLSRHWTTLCYITAGCGAFLLSYFRFIPESPRWLLSQDKFESAKKIMIEIVNVNGKSENETEMLLCLKAVVERMKKEKEDSSGKSESKSVIFKYPRLRKHFFILAFFSFTIQVGYIGLTYNLVNLYGNEFINFFLISVVEFPGNLIFWYAMNNVGRRWTATVGFLLTGVFSLLPVIGFKYSDILSSMIGKFLITGCFMVSDQQGTELFPTVLRSSAIAAAKSLSGAMGLFVPFIAYLSMYGHSLPFVVISCVCLVASGLSTFLPESLNENLPQTVIDAERFGRDQKFLSMNKRIPASKANHLPVAQNEAEMQENISPLSEND